MSMYVGVTIGPIFETIEEASFPAALWFSSTLFSDLTRRLCIRILALENKVTLIAPAFDEKDQNGLHDGIGKYHDHIIFKFTSDNPDAQEKYEIKEYLDKIIEEEKKATANQFASANGKGGDFKNCEYQEFLYKYLQIHYCILEESVVGNENCILFLSPYLDALECMKTFPVSNINNPFKDIMKKSESESVNSDRSSSEYIKQSPLFTGITQSRNQLTGQNSKDSIWKISDIADGSVTGTNGEDTELKYKRYYAVVTADADNMTTFLQSLTMESTMAFSAQCLEFSSKASQEIREFGGMTIYAGGDDLLFLAPVMNNSEGDTKSIVDLCSKLIKLFRETIEKKSCFAASAIPTLSFGISVQYVNYPLYEALKSSRNLLEDVKHHVKGKNAVEMNIQKHSGQQMGVILKNEILSKAEDFLLELYKTIKKNDDSSLQSVLMGIGGKLEQQYALLDTMDKLGLEKTTWENIFDNEGQSKAGDYVNAINTFYYQDLKTADCSIKSLIDQKTKDRFGYHNENLNALLTLLRIRRFFVEKADEREVE